jgi:hypothetical protein
MLSRETIIEENGDSDGEGSEAGNNFKVRYTRSFSSLRGDRGNMIGLWTHLHTDPNTIHLKSLDPTNVNHVFTIRGVK